MYTARLLYGDIEFAPDTKRGVFTLVNAYREMFIHIYMYTARLLHGRVEIAPDTKKVFTLVIREWIYIHIYIDTSTYFHVHSVPGLR